MGRGISNACTTDVRPPGRSTAPESACRRRSADHEDNDEQDEKQTDDERKCGDIAWLGGLHRHYPSKIGLPAGPTSRIDGRSYSCAACAAVDHLNGQVALTRIRIAVREPSGPTISWA